MKSYKILSKNRIKAIIGLFFLAVSTHIMPMQRALSQQTPAQKRAIIARQTAFKKIQAKKIALVDHPAEITACHISKDDTTIVTSSKGNIDNLILWNAKTGEKIKAMSIAGGDIQYLYISHDGNMIITSAKKNPDDSNDILTLVNVKNDKITPLKHPQGFHTQVEFSSDGTKFAYEIKDPKNFHLIISDDKGYPINQSKSTEQFEFALNPKNNSMAILSPDKLLTMYNLNPFTKKIPINYSVYFSQYSCCPDLNYSEDGTTIIIETTIPDYNTTLLILDSSTGELRDTIYGGNDFSYSTDPSATKIISYHRAMPIQLRDTKTKEEAFIAQVFFTSYTEKPALALSPNAKLMAISGAPYTDIQIWDVAAQEKIHQIDGLSSSTDIELTFSSDNKRIESRSHIEDKCYISIYDIATQRLMHTFKGDEEVYDATSDLLTVVEPDTSDNKNGIFIQLSEAQIPKINTPKPAARPLAQSAPRLAYPPAQQTIAVQQPARQVAAPTKPIITETPAPAPVEVAKPQSWWQWMTSGW